MIDDDGYDSDIYGVWDPIGNPHSFECPCPRCDPSGEQAKADAEREAKVEAERKRIAASRAMSKAVREHREKWDSERLAEDDRWSGISYRLAMGLDVSPEDKRWHDRVLAERRERYERTKGES